MHNKKSKVYLRTLYALLICVFSKIRSC